MLQKQGTIIGCYTQILLLYRVLCTEEDDAPKIYKIIDHNDMVNTFRTLIS